MTEALQNNTFMCKILISISENPAWNTCSYSESPVATANQQVSLPSTSATSGHVQPQQPGSTR